MFSLTKRKPSSAIDAGGAIEDTDIAIQKMKDSGFDLGTDINQEQRIPRFADGGTTRHWERVTPMTNFVIKGDLKMCRYLFVNGAKCTRPTLARYKNFPLLMAAKEGHIDICKWLYMHGAKEDIQKLDLMGDGTPLRSTILTQRCFYAYTREYVKKKFSVSQWLILNGALCCQDYNDSGQIDEVVLKRDLSIDSRPMFLSWAQDELKIRNNFLFFLYGTSTNQHKQQHLFFNGNKSGIMENIADYVGIVRGRDLRIIRQLASILSTLIQEDEESSN
ncbi:hypothetical protein FRACYDRAFT_238301 [Fragilariopsis cylindrus CCMP1102]|uniref:Uncharacterized protein n=1 Tax=Fragilariopsis cylindrus CCMP1102 TaxID=635003 RepID=A0A1E7FJB5_9STRA|nr:hypothetical protein FRACYDRAFT_238301 [Fragilariopsis cylindrus CCMP1102]|eukprot:OEU17873.1 hypothetical protein FRACYDRAFT_238301 [Fragilariopsis cylindrus CCMP1102]